MPVRLGPDPVGGFLGIFEDMRVIRTTYGANFHGPSDPWQVQDPSSPWRTRLIVTQYASRTRDLFLDI
jgi:hypothetical protein